MKATDLRIGNLVYFPSNIIKQVCEIDRTMFAFHNGLTNLEDYKPIPLTEEWLLKFGFEPMTCISFDWQTEYIISPKTLAWSIGVLLGDYPEDNPNCGALSILQPNDIEEGSIPSDLYDKEEWTEEDRLRVLNYRETIPKWRQPIAFYIKYVHQLQNLYFSLIGEELTIS